MYETAKHGRLASLMLGDELAHLIDGPDAVDVTLALGVSPREQPVAAENQTVGARMIRNCLLDQQRQLESRPLPRHPDDASAVVSIEFFQLAVAVGAGSQRNGPVRMKVIDMRKGQKRMERCIDRRGNGVMAERRQRVIGHQLVFVRLASILLFKRLDAIQVEQREAGVGNRPEVAAAPFNREHTNRLARERIGQLDFRAGVAAAEIGDA